MIFNSCFLDEVFGGLDNSEILSNPPSNPQQPLPIKEFPPSLAVLTAQWPLPLDQDRAKCQAPLSLPLSPLSKVCLLMVASKPRWTCIGGRKAFYRVQRAFLKYYQDPEFGLRNMWNNSQIRFYNQEPEQAI